MNSTQIYTIGLAICNILLLILLGIILNYKKKEQINKAFIFVILCLLICCIGQLSSLLFIDYLNIAPIYFDYFVYIGTCFLPVAFWFFSMVFSKTKIQFKKRYLLLFVIPVLSLIILWTNDFHHLFYITYSQQTVETVFGPYFYVHSIYSFALFFFALLYLIRYSIRNSGFFSKQSVLIIIGSLFPIIINLLGSLGIPMSIYLTPMSFTITVLLFAFAIFKFQFLSVAPIALQRIVDNISDGYIVLNENNIITDFNKTFLTIFNLSASTLRNSKLDDLVKSNSYDEIDLVMLKDSIAQVKNSNKTVKFEKEFKAINKFFNIEVNSIYNNNNFLGTLILFKDVTQHNLDMQIIKSNQEMLMEKERLASLGQLIGGIAHNLKTPIMSISGAAEGLNDLTKEYDSSIEDPEVNFNDHHAIAKDMFEWIDKIKTHTSYMSDVITAVKGQAVALSGDQVSTFTMEELIKHVNILMRHELKNALVDLNVSMQVEPDLEYKGNINSLVQVINNMISNAIQAYKGETGKAIDLIVTKDNNKLIISIKDYGPGMSKEVKDKLFKEMITTKGKNGTGLGLFMSYSNIRAHFNGNITVESELGKGTIFNIILPLN